MKIVIESEHSALVNPLEAMGTNRQNEDIVIFTYGLNDSGDIEICFKEPCDETDLNNAIYMLWKWAAELDISATCWNPVITQEETEIEFERAVWRELNKEVSQSTDLLSSYDLIAMVDNYVSKFPASFRMPGMMEDWGDVINETGLSDIDEFSVANMLCHFYQTRYADKAEWMTYLAYSQKLNITPVAIALTPMLASLVLRDRRGS